MAPMVTALLIAALAIPPDPPIELQSPADGATLAVNADGIAVRFTCGPYTETPAFPPFPATPGLPSDHGTGMSSSPAVGADGRLATRDGIGSATEVADGVCESTLGSGGFPKPQATPGTWYWQAWRSCSGCDTGWEVSAVRRFVLAADATLRLKAPRRAYAGYAFATTTTRTGTSIASKLTLERKVGSRWRAAGTGEDVILKLPRGPQQLRATGVFGAQTVSSPAVKVTVAKASRWQTSKRDDGAYRDAARPSVRLRVTGGGRRIIGFKADVPTICSSTTSNTGTAPGISHARPARAQARARRRLRRRRHLQGHPLPLHRQAQAAQADRRAGRDQHVDVRGFDQRGGEAARLTVRCGASTASTCSRIQSASEPSRWIAQPIIAP